MARKKLDRSKDFGHVSPPWMGAVYHQDGTLFDARGHEIFTDADDTDEKRRESIDRWEKGEAQANLMRQAREAKKADAPPQASGEEGEQTDDETEETGATEPDDPDAVDLRAWAMGAKKYPWFKITKAIEETYHRDVTKKTDAIDTLIEKGLVLPTEVAA